MTMTDEAWRQPGRALRAKCEDTLNLELSSECPVEDYLEVANEILQHLLDHPMNAPSDLLRAYMLGHRLQKLLRDLLPKHPQFKTIHKDIAAEQLRIAKLCTEQAALLIDQHSKLHYDGDAIYNSDESEDSGIVEIQRPRITAIASPVASFDDGSELSPIPPIPEDFVSVPPTIDAESFVKATKPNESNVLKYTARKPSRKQIIVSPERESPRSNTLLSQVFGSILLHDVVPGMNMDDESSSERQGTPVKETLKAASASISREDPTDNKLVRSNEMPNLQRLSRAGHEAAFVDSKPSHQLPNIPKSNNTTTRPVLKNENLKSSDERQVGTTGSTVGSKECYQETNLQGNMDTGALAHNESEPDGGRSAHVDTKEKNRHSKENERLPRKEIPRKELEAEALSKLKIPDRFPKSLFSQDSANTESIQTATKLKDPTSSRYDDLNDATYSHTLDVAARLSAKVSSIRRRREAVIRTNTLHECPRASHERSGNNSSAIDKLSEDSHFGPKQQVLSTRPHVTEMQRQGSSDTFFDGDTWAGPNISTRSSHAPDIATTSPVFHYSRGERQNQRREWQEFGSFQDEIDEIIGRLAKDATPVTNDGDFETPHTDCPDGNDDNELFLTPHFTDDSTSINVHDGFSSWNSSLRSSIKPSKKPPQCRNSSSGAERRSRSQDSTDGVLAVSSSFSPSGINSSETSFNVDWGAISMEQSTGDYLDRLDLLAIGPANKANDSDRNVEEETTRERQHALFSHLQESTPSLPGSTGKGREQSIPYPDFAWQRHNATEKDDKHWSSHNSIASKKQELRAKPNYTPPSVNATDLAVDWDQSLVQWEESQNEMMIGNAGKIRRNNFRGCVRFLFE